MAAIPHRTLTAPRRAPIAPLVLALLVALASLPLSEAVAWRPAHAQASAPLTVYWSLSLPFEFGLVPVSVLPRDGKPAALDALERLIEGPPAGSLLFGPVPAGTRVLGLVIADGLATVDFSAEILQNSYGSSGEAMLLGCIVNTLTTTPGVERVRILVEGRDPGSLGGHVDITEPLAYNGHVIFHQPFADVEGHWAGGYIVAFYLTGIVHGYPDGEYRPENEVTREEFVKLLVLAAGHEPSGAGGPSFTDVQPDRWSYPYLETGVRTGIIRPQDYFGGQFGPAASLTRREMSVLLVRAAGQEALAATLVGADLDYTDVGDQPGWARGYIAAATRLGLMRGYPDGTFRPGRTVRRSEAATVLARLRGLGEGQNFMLEPAAGAVVGDRVLILGVACAFEATVQARVRDASDNPYAGTYTTATDGGPGWGVYGAVLPVPAGAGPFAVEAYESSAKDGSEINLVRRSVSRAP